MDNLKHLQLLERIYLSAPVHQRLGAVEMNLSTGECVLQSTVDPGLFHSGGSLHGSLYFRLLDDAAFFAAATIESEYFILTRNFEVEFRKPVMAGQLKAVGKLLDSDGRMYRAESALFLEDVCVARGNGSFLRSKIKWTEADPEQSQRRPNY